MLKTELIYKILSLKGIGNVKANKILFTLNNELNNDSIENYDNLFDSYLTKEQINELKNQNSYHFEVQKRFPVFFSSILDKNYPQRIRQTLSTNAPTIISYIGNYDLLNKEAVGFCGSRKASKKGLNVAQDCVEQLTNKSIVIVSGYASGIDHQCHYHALKNGGSTIIVLPEGINNFGIKKELKDVWDWDRVLIISEFDPDAIWSAGRAMQRNTTIIALSDIMMLIESGDTGGSMDAGKKTLKLKKYLFTPIYEGMPENAIGNQILINEGAIPIHKSKQTMRANLSKLFDFLNTKNNNNLLF